MTDLSGLFTPLLVLAGMITALAILCFGPFMVVFLAGGWARAFIPNESPLAPGQITARRLYVGLGLLSPVLVILGLVASQLYSTNQYCFPLNAMLGLATHPGWSVLGLFGFAFLALRSMKSARKPFFLRFLGLLALVCYGVTLVLALTQAQFISTVALGYPAQYFLIQNECLSIALFRNARLSVAERGPRELFLAPFLALLCAALVFVLALQMPAFSD
jgi:hypothetical protein